MFFTEEDYRKIEKWLLSKGIMDTQFSAATTIDGNETIAIVQNGKNVNATIDALVEKLFLLGVDDFLNVTDKYEQPAIPLIRAISLIPFRHRRIGQVITFLNEDNKWVIYQFQGSALTQWNNPTQWVNVIDSAITGELVPDEEDLTGIKEGDNTVLKFKNKAYSTANFSGLGRVYLRKNIAGGRNILTQQMINQENTRYILQYDYDLNGQTVTIPNNCVIEFEGGSISNGKLLGDVLIESEDVVIFKNVEVNYIINKVHTSWFDNNQIQQAIDSINQGLVYVTDNIELNEPVIINKDNISIDGLDHIIYFNPSVPSSVAISIQPVTGNSSYIRNITLSNFILQPYSGNSNIEYFISARRVAQFNIDKVALYGFNWNAQNTVLVSNGMYMIECMYHSINNLYIQKFTDYGINIDTGEFISTTVNLENSVIDQCSKGLRVESTNKMSCNNCTFQANSMYGVTVGENSTSHVDFNSCHFESNVVDILGGNGGNIGKTAWVEATNCLFIGPPSTPDRECAIYLDWGLLKLDGCSYPKNQYLFKYTDNLQEAIVIDFTYWEDRTSQKVYTGPESKVGTAIKIFNQDISQNATPTFKGLSLKDTTKYGNRGYQLNESFKVFKVGDGTTGNLIKIPILTDANYNHSAIVKLLGYDAKGNNTTPNSFECVLEVGYSQYSDSMNLKILNMSGFIDTITSVDKDILIKVPATLNGVYLVLTSLVETPFSFINYSGISLTTDSNNISNSGNNIAYLNPDGTLANKVVII